MNFDTVIEAKNIVKKYRNFTLNVPEFCLPKGFATALIGENGAGKTTFLNCLAGIRRDFTGELTLFGKFDRVELDKDPEVKERIGYTGTDNYYLPNWTLGQVDDLSGLLFEKYNSEKFKAYCKELAVFGAGPFEKGKKINSFSDGTKTKLMLAGVLARETDVLILDEPASPLDPLMREKLCELIRDYLNRGEGKSVFFSTHNISDMESVTDYAVIMEQGRIVEQGFVDELKEKYIYVKGEPSDADAAAPYMYTMNKSGYGFEGICLAENLDKLAGLKVETETPSLFKISVAVMRKNSLIK